MIDFHMALDFCQANLRTVGQTQDGQDNPDFLQNGNAAIANSPDKTPDALSFAEFPPLGQ